MVDRDTFSRGQDGVAVILGGHAKVNAQRGARIIAVEQATVLEKWGHLVHERGKPSS
jgi:hypothetical protein